MQPSPALSLAKSAATRLRGEGFQAWLVGGCVRDALMGIEPKDYDLATDAAPNEVLALYPDALQVGAHFGVTLLKRDGAQIEIATFRSDGAYSDGRHPDRVRFEKDPKADASRRDFTINALFMDPATGEVRDYVGGRADIEGRMIRAIGEPRRRFAEDHLRMLRAIRFAARLGFSIDLETLTAIKELRREIHSVSLERVRDEITRILTEGGARLGFELLDECGLLVELLPEISSLKGVQQPPEFHPEGDVWIHTMMMLEKLRSPSVTQALGVLLHDIGKPGTYRVADRIRFDGHAELGARMARAVCERLRYSNAETDRVEALVANHMRFMDVQRMRESTLKKFMRADGFDEYLELHRVDCLASNGRLDNHDFVREKLATQRPEALRPPRLLTGFDLQALGYTPGPRFKRILEFVEDGQLEGRLVSKEAAIEAVNREFGLKPSEVW